MIRLFRRTSAFERVTRNIERGKYKSHLRPSMTLREVVEEQARAKYEFKEDVLDAYGMDDPIGCRLFDLSWERLNDKGPDSVLAHFSQQLAQYLALDGDHHASG